MASGYILSLNSENGREKADESTRRRNVREDVTGVNERGLSVPPAAGEGFSQFVLSRGKMSQKHSERSNCGTCDLPSSREHNNRIYNNGNHKFQ